MRKKLTLNKTKIFTGCPVCGSALTTIRGRYLRQPDREICPTCAQEKLEMLRDILRADYGQAYQSQDPPTKMV